MDASISFCFRPTRGAGVRALLFLCLLSSGCKPVPEPVEIPKELYGVWETDAPKYADRFFEVRVDRTLAFGLGGRNVEVSPIVGVTLERDGSFYIYHIEHLNDVGDVYRFSISYHPGRPGQLIFRNQPNVVWTKKDTRRSTHVVGRLRESP